METFTSESKSELPLVWRTRSSMLVDRRPYNDQNKDQTDQKVGQRKTGKKKKDDRVERTKDHQQRTKTELNCQCVIELRVFLSQFTVNFEFENWVVYGSPEVNRLSSVTCQDYRPTAVKSWHFLRWFVRWWRWCPLLDLTSQPVELFWRDCMFLFV